MEQADIKQIIQKAGGATALAKRLGIKSPSVHSWQKVPPARVLAVAEITGIPAWEIRSDLYPLPAEYASCIVTNGPEA
ncbi:transcriptional regulator [Acetobacter cerevisiae]|uniref:transcriptional regulator n=1 Tax=Acetobacter cerevisiae TaxID=178900 RepID=UPI00342D0599